MMRHLAEDASHTYLTTGATNFWKQIYDKNDVFLATKKLFDGMKFQWLRTPDEVKQISFQQEELLALKDLVKNSRSNLRKKMSALKNKIASLRNSGSGLKT